MFEILNRFALIPLSGWSAAGGKTLYSFSPVGHMAASSPITPLGARSPLAGWVVTWVTDETIPTSSNGSIVVKNDVILEADYTLEYEELFEDLVEIVKAKIMNETKTVHDPDFCRGRLT